jgi:hypothetical protein
VAILARQLGLAIGDIFIREPLCRLAHLVSALALWRLAAGSG